MSSTSNSQRSIPRSTIPVVKVLVTLLGAGIVFILLLIGLVIGYDSHYTGRFYPEISVAGISLSGMDPAEAAVILSQRMDYPTRGRIILRDGSKAWLVSPSQFGFYFDPETTALSGYMIGRNGGVLERVAERFITWYRGQSLSPQYVFDERTALNFLMDVAAQTNLPTIDAVLRLEGVNVVATSGQVGRTLDIPATLEALKAQTQTMSDGEVQLVIHDMPPAIMYVDQQANLLRQILSAPLNLFVPEAQPGDPVPLPIAPDILAKMIVIARVKENQTEHIQITLNGELLRPTLEGIRPLLGIDRLNARFSFNDDTHLLDVIQPAVVGRALAVESSLKSITQKLLAGEHNIPLELVYTQPEIGNDVTAEKLGITGLVVSYTSYFRGSSAARIQNIKTAAGRFHGVMVPPGAILSMADIMGDVSLDSGYAEALIIYNGRTIQGVGGGVCQVSTTLFRTAFFGGYPIVERNPHAYRVGYYEQISNFRSDAKLAGLDATVFVPVVDFRFKNDRSAWLLMETYVNPSAYTLTWKFYSIQDGRSITWDSTGPQNTVTPPEPRYEENPELATGEIKQVDWEAEGADVVVTRTVTLNGQVLFNDTFTTHYQPWQAVYQYGPGTEGMPPKPKKK